MVFLPAPFLSKTVSLGLFLPPKRKSFAEKGHSFSG
jgi:hypothetical protein